MQIRQQLQGTTTSQPRGFSLVESLVAITLIVVVMGTAVKILHSLLGSERRGIEHVTRLMTVSRLARQFRADVHATTDLQLAAADPAKSLLQLTTDAQHQIHYEIRPQGLLRTETGPAPSVPTQELLRLKGARFRIVESPAPPRMVTLVIETPDAFAASAKQLADESREVHIEAVVGRDFRDQ